MAMSRKRVAVLISGRGSNMTALIAAARAADYPAEIAVVISNRPDAAGLAHAASAGIATATVDHTAFGKDREAFERELQRHFKSYAVDIVCLAGFMRLLTPWLVQQWSGRMINIHPALLPSFKGLQTHEAALRAGVKIHGATVHFVVPDMDSGPIIAQAAVPVHEDDTPDTLAHRVLTAEHRIYPQALRMVTEGRTRIVDGRCLIADAKAGDGVLIVPGDAR
jgi:phosphoribosylglycinamide formyltransferase-1